MLTLTESAPAVVPHCWSKRRRSRNADERRCAEDLRSVITRDALR